MGSEELRVGSAGDGPDAGAGELLERQDFVCQHERYTRYSVYLLLKGPRRRFAAADEERRPGDGKG